MEGDWEGWVPPKVALVAKELNPVHVYPLIPPENDTFCKSTVRSAHRVAHATGGQAIQVRSAAELPSPLVKAVKMAVGRHRREVWPGIP